MTPETKKALSQLGFHPNGHRARSLTAELTTQAHKIFCMTEEQRSIVLSLVPAVLEKTRRLDPDSDIEDPMGSGIEAYVRCARHIHRMICARLDEIA